jgi:hypothetical protein
VVVFSPWRDGAVVSESPDPQLVLASSMYTSVLAVSASTLLAWHNSNRSVVPLCQLCRCASRGRSRSERRLVTEPDVPVA